LFTKTTEGVGSLVDVTSERGLTGLLQSLLGLTPEGLVKQVDSVLGTGIIRLLMDGDKRGVNTAMSYREYVIGFLGEMKELGDTLFKFSSEDLAETKEAVAEMKTFIAEKESKYGRSKRERELEAELQGLRDKVREISELAEGGYSRESFSPGEAEPVNLSYE
jgi:hypothetical protein